MQAHLTTEYGGNPAREFIYCKKVFIIERLQEPPTTRANFTDLAFQNKSNLNKQIKFIQKRFQNGVRCRHRSYSICVTKGARYSTNVVRKCLKFTAESTTFDTVAKRCFATHDEDIDYFKDSSTLYIYKSYIFNRMRIYSTVQLCSITSLWHSGQRLCRAIGRLQVRISLGFWLLSKRRSLSS